MRPAGNRSSMMVATIRHFDQTDKAHFPSIGMQPQDRFSAIHKVSVFSQR